MSTRRHEVLKQIAAVVTVAALVVVVVPARAQAATLVSITPAVQQMTEGDTTHVSVEVSDVTGLFALDITLQFDPSALEVVGASPGLRFAPVTPGPFMDSGSISVNQANNTTGQVHYAMTQLNASEPKSGSGVLFSMNLRARKGGATYTLELTKVQLLHRDGSQISALSRSGQISVGITPLITPTQTIIPSQATATLTATPPATPTAPTPPESAPTPDISPITDSTPDSTMEPIPVMEPTSTLVSTPTPTALATKPATATVLASATPKESALRSTSVMTSLPTQDASRTITIQPPTAKVVPTQTMTGTLTANGKEKLRDSEAATLAPAPSAMIRGQGQVTSQASQQVIASSQFQSLEHAAPVDTREQLIRATIETLVAFALCCIGLIILIAGIAVFYILTRPVKTRTWRQL